MRTSEQISKIKERIEEPFVIENILDESDIEHLKNIFYKNSESSGPYSNLIHKNTGPITLDLKHYIDDEVVKKVLKKLNYSIGPFEITAAFFFRTDFPHIIHNDDTFELPEEVYKGITLPLYLENFNGTYPKLCFFNQFYFHGPAKFFKGSNNIPTYYNKQVYEYSDVTDLVDIDFIDENNYFTHLKSQWLEGLSLNSTLDWVPGNALIFDSTRLHCASDFRNLGIKSKLGISIFTKRK